MSTKVKEYNKSLSARIKRRNKQGFAGVGSHVCSRFSKESCGNYNDYKTATPKEEETRQRNLSIICEAMRVGVVSKHPGSKSIGKIVKMLRSLHKSTALHKVFIESKAG